MKENRKLLKEVLEEIRHDMTNEEVLNLLADSKISENTSRTSEKYTIGQRAADAIAKFAGSWAFIFLLLVNVFKTYWLMTRQPYRLITSQEQYQ